LPKNSLTATSIEASLIILRKSSSKVSDYNIFMSHIDKIGVDFLFTKKEIIKKYNEFKNKKSIKNETDLGFSVNTNELNENWSVSDKKPSQKAIIKALKFSNPVHLKEVAEIIRPLRKYTKLDDIIRIRDIEHLADLKNIKIGGEVDSSLFEPGDILFSISGTIGKTIKITTKIPNVGLSSGLVIIRPDTSKINSDYLKHVLDSNNTRLQLVTKGTVIPFLSTKQISDIKIDLIEFKKQKVIIEEIQELQNKISELKTQIIKYENDIENITTKKT
jgi:restriction endonuclease S subunit